MSNKRLIVETLALALMLGLLFTSGGAFLGTLAHVIVRGSSDDWLALIYVGILAPVFIGMWNAGFRGHPDPLPNYARELWRRPRWQRRLHLLFLYLVVFAIAVQTARYWLPAECLEG